MWSIWLRYRESVIQRKIARHCIYSCPDADDFNPEAGFVKASEGGEDVWEGEDEGLVVVEGKDDPKPKR